MIINECVLLLKSQSSDGTSDDYENILTSKGFQVRNVKPISFNFRNIDILKEMLSDSSSYQGIIFSSPRSVQAVCQALQNDENNIIEPWLEKNNFAVGPKTRETALDKLGLYCVGEEAGSVQNLSKIILENKSLYDKPFLWPHGNLCANKLAMELGKEVQIVDLLVYDTIANPDISKELMEVTDKFTTIPEYVVFFSPSGFHSSIDHLEKHAVNLDDVKFIAIGSVTESAIKTRNYHVYGVTKKPTPHDLLNLLRQT